MNERLDYQQQELEEERLMANLAVLQRVELCLATAGDVRFLASELGLTTEWRKLCPESAK